MISVLSGAPFRACLDNAWTALFPNPHRIVFSLHRSCFSSTKQQVLLQASFRIIPFFRPSPLLAWSGRKTIAADILLLVSLLFWPSALQPMALLYCGLDSEVSSKIFIVTRWNIGAQWCKKLGYRFWFKPRLVIGPELAWPECNPWFPWAITRTSMEMFSGFFRRAGRHNAIRMTSCFVAQNCKGMKTAGRWKPCELRAAAVVAWLSSVELAA